MDEDDLAFEESVRRGRNRSIKAQLVNDDGGGGGDGGDGDGGDGDGGGGDDGDGGLFFQRKPVWKFTVIDQ